MGEGGGDREAPWGFNLGTFPGQGGRKSVGNVQIPPEHTDDKLWRDEQMPITNL